MSYAEVVGRPKGFIRAVRHVGDPVVLPWHMLDPDIPPVDSRFGVLDLSKVEIVGDWRDPNTIVNQSAVLQVQRMAPGNQGTAGIGYLALGNGPGTGTLSAPEGESLAYKTLRSEFARKAITSWTYVDSNGSPVATPPDGVGIIQLTTTFSATEAIGNICEMGLFGGIATLTANSGTMFNYKAFGAWPKTLALNVPLTIIWTLQF